MLSGLFRVRTRRPQGAGASTVSLQRHPGFAEWPVRPEQESLQPPHHDAVGQQCRTTQHKHVRPHQGPLGSGSAPAPAAGAAAAPGGRRRKKSPARSPAARAMSDVAHARSGAGSGCALTSAAAAAAPACRLRTPQPGCVQHSCRSRRPPTPCAVRWVGQGCQYSVPVLQHSRRSCRPPMACAWEKRL